jgi:hypothetical protein
MAAERNSGSERRRDANICWTRELSEMTLSFITGGG